MSAASAGSVCVSSATTSSPAWRALSSDGTIALESDGVIIRPFAPAEIRLSTAATCDSLSPSFLPAKDCNSPPSSLALASAPSFILTKNGFVSVLVIRPTLNASPPPPPLPPLDDAPPPLSLPQAVTPAARASADATANAPRAWISDLIRSLPLLLVSGPDRRETTFSERVLAPQRHAVKQLVKTNSEWTTARRGRMVPNRGNVYRATADDEGGGPRRRRDLTASTLRRADRQSASIGLIIEDVSNPFFSAVHRGVEDVARPHGVLTFVGSSDELPERERELAETFGARGVDGLVIVPCAPDQSYLMRDRDAGTALVFVDRPPRFMPGHAVVSDNVGGARRAVEHLVAAGHTRIAFLGDRLDVFTAQERQ